MLVDLPAVVDRIADVTVECLSLYFELTLPSTTDFLELEAPWLFLFKGPRSMAIPLPQSIERLLGACRFAGCRMAMSWQWILANQTSLPSAVCCNHIKPRRHS